jgi:hypothetical protein
MRTFLPQRLAIAQRSPWDLYSAEVVLIRNWHRLGVVQFDYVEDVNAAALMFNGNKIEEA